jgi:hypothetical protein
MTLDDTLAGLQFSLENLRPEDIGESALDELIALSVQCTLLSSSGAYHDVAEPASLLTEVDCNMAASKRYFRDYFPSPAWGDSRRGRESRRGCDLA